MADKKYKILIVDDDEFLLDIYAAKFREKGVEVEMAKSGEAALDLLRGGGSYDMVLLDIVMPSMDGLELLAKIREEDIAGKASLVVLSNQGQQSDIDQANQYNIDGYIVKASSVPSEVLEEAMAILEERQSSQTDLS